MASAFKNHYLLMTELNGHRAAWLLCLGLAQYRFGTVYVFSEPSILNHKCRFIHSCVLKYKPLKSAQFLVWDRSLEFGKVGPPCLTFQLGWKGGRKCFQERKASWKDDKTETYSKTRHLQLEISQILLFFCRIRPSKWKRWTQPRGLLKMLPILR